MDPDFDADASRSSVPDNFNAEATASRTESPLPAAGTALGNEAAPAPRFTVDKRINEEYKIWKKNIPFLYDTLMMTATQFPSYTVDWVPEVLDGKDEDTDAEFRVQKIVLGTTATNDDVVHLNGVILMDVRTPVSKSDPQRFHKLDDKQSTFRPEVGFFTGQYSSLFTTGILPHALPVINVRVMPQQAKLLAAKLADSRIVISDWKNDLKYGWSYDDPVEEKAPMVELVGLEEHRLGAAHGLVWNATTHKEGWIASCGKDGRVLVWDVLGFSGNYWHGHGVRPVVSITGHDAQVEDIAWHPVHPTILASAGTDKCFCLFDIRSRNLSKPSHRVEAHTATVNAVSFAFSQVLLATASDDQTVALWDMRNLGRKLHSLQHHTGDVFSLDWCHDLERTELLASAGADRRICIWDVTKIGQKTERSVEVYTPPELLFVHGGHTGRVTDVCWNPAMGRKFMLASVAEDSIVQAWMPARYQLSQIDRNKEKFAVAKDAPATAVQPSSSEEAPPCVPQAPVETMA